MARARTRAADARGGLTLSWRDALTIHPAAELFPLMSEEECNALGETLKGRAVCEFLSSCGRSKSSRCPSCSMGATASMGWRPPA
jgi:hypothetical protein